MRKKVVSTLLGSLLVTSVALPTPATAACVADPGALPFRQMILQGRTGVNGYRILLLGQVAAIKDLGGKKGGWTIAKLAVAAHPAGWGPLVSRVRFWRNPPGVSSGENLDFHTGRRYAVVARHREDGAFRSDGACGQTSELSHERFLRLVELADA